MTADRQHGPDGGTAVEAPPAWFRESVERTFRVGDRVRIVNRGECDVHALEDPRVYANLDGRTGCVAATHGSLFPKHPIKVILDQPYPGRARIGKGPIIGGSWCAPLELEPLMAPEAADDDGEGVL